MSSRNTKRTHTQPVGPKQEEELLVFGYSCKIFRDDEKAIYIDQGKHLIPWMGDENLMIDRYDVRGYLHDLSSFETKQYHEIEMDEEERLCEEERYLALHSNLTEEELYHEEELKRLRAALASDGAYHEIGFSYDSIEDSTNQEQQNLLKGEEEEVEDEPYQIPEGLTVPKGMPTPSNMKIHAIIEKTANFISRQGGQMEIIIKMKQSDNPQFAFMNLDNPLHSYYRHLVQQIKSGSYKPPPEKKRKESEDEHGEDHYLHPSLLSGVAEVVPKFTVPSINFLRTGDDSYSMLVKNLKQRVEEDSVRHSQAIHEASQRLSNSSNVSKSSKKKRPSKDDFLSDDSTSSSDVSDIEPMVFPPPGVQPIIDKMAEYVAKNGEDFETIVMAKKDKRFDFLKSGNKFFRYYVYKKTTAREAFFPSVKIEKVKKTNSPKNGTPPPSLSSSREIDTGSNASNDSLQHDQYDSPLPTVSDLAKNELNHNEQLKNEVDSPIESKAKSKLSSIKVVKGPISFALKAKENETPSLEKSKKHSLLLDDSDGEETSKGSNEDSDKTSDSSVSHLLRKSTDDVEERPKKLTSEELEQKMAEEKIKDKLVAAARERLVQNKKDKQLQLERKQKAALFLQMLAEKKALANSVKDMPPATEGGDKSCESPPPEEVTSPDRVIPISSYPPSPIRTDLPEYHPLSPPSVSGQTVNNSKKTEDDKYEESSSKMKVGNSKSSDKKKSSHSQSDKHSRLDRKRRRSKSPSPSRKHKRSSSKPKKEKKLPAAYAIARQSRSRSRSPNRYGNRMRVRSPLAYRNRWR